MPGVQFYDIISDANYKGVIYKYSCIFAEPEVGHGRRGGSRFGNMTTAKDAKGAKTQIVMPFALLAAFAVQTRGSFESRP